MGGTTTTATAGVFQDEEVGPGEGDEDALPDLQLGRHRPGQLGRLARTDRNLARTFWWSLFQCWHRRKRKEKPFCYMITFICAIP